MNRVFIVILITICFKAEAQSSALELADKLYRNGKYTKAIEAYKAYTNQAEIFDKIAKSYIALGNYDEGLKNYQQSIEANPDENLFKFEYAKLLSRVKKYDEATAMFKSLVSLDSLNPNYHYELGLNLQKIKDTLAHESFLKTFELDPTHQKAIFRIARRHLVKRRHTKVDYYVDKGLESYTNNKDLISLKAQNFYWKEDYENSAKWFEKLISLNEKTQQIYEKLSFCYSKLYENEKAIEYGLEALKFDAGNTTNLIIQSQLYETQAQYFKKEEDYKKAEEYMLQALKLLDKPLDAEYAQLSGIYSTQKKNKEALDYMKIAIEENPNNSFNQFRMVLIKGEYYEDIDAKIKVYEDFIKNFPKAREKQFAEYRLKALKEEKFLKVED